MDGVLILVTLTVLRLVVPIGLLLALGDLLTHRRPTH